MTTDAQLQTLENAPEIARVRERLAEAVRRICPAWLAAQIDDIVQQSCLRVAEILKRNEGGGPVRSSYLWKVAYSVTVDEIRKARRLREEQLEPGHVETHGGEDALDPERRWAGREIGMAILDCLRGVIAPRRRALSLYLLGHGLGECARLLGEKYKTAENLVLRGLADLRSCLESKGIHP